MAPMASPAQSCSGAKQLTMTMVAANATEISTTAPNELCAEIHNQVPVILKPEGWPVWLGEEPADAPRLKALLAPYPSAEMVAWPVSARVGNVKNNDPSIIEPIAVAG